mgnify:FL=1
MSTKSQCAAIIATFKNRWFDTGIAFDRLRVQSLHRRLTDIEGMGYRVDRAKHPNIQRAKIYRISGKVL